MVFLGVVALFLAHLPSDDYEGCKRRENEGGKQQGKKVADHPRPLQRRRRRRRREGGRKREERGLNQRESTPGEPTDRPRVNERADGGDDVVGGGGLRLRAILDVQILRGFFRRPPLSLLAYIASERSRTRSSSRSSCSSSPSVRSPQLAAGGRGCQSTSQTERERKECEGREEKGLRDASESKAKPPEVSSQCSVLPETGIHQRRRRQI
jgi:hypothetical protein